MKQSIIMIICIVIIVVGGVFEIKYLEKSSLYLSSDIEYIQNAIQNKNYDVALTQTNSTYSSWKSVKNIWNIFVNHDEIDEIESAIIELKEHLSFENDEECLVAIEKIKRNLEHTVERQKVKIDNIL